MANLTSHDLRPCYFSTTVTGNRFVSLENVITSAGIISVIPAISGSIPEGVVLTTMTASTTGKYIHQYGGAIVELEVVGAITAGMLLMPIAGGKAKVAAQYTTTTPVYPGAVALEDCASVSLCKARLIQPYRIDA